MKLAILTEAPVRTVKQSHPSFVGNGNWVIDTNAKSKLSIRVAPYTDGDEQSSVVKPGDLITGPAFIQVFIDEIHPDDNRISVYAEKIIT
jgi:hypothetical protein